MKKDFIALTQQVWQTKGLNAKKKVMNEMIDSFAVKGVGKFKIHEFRFKHAVDKARSSDEMDQLATNIMLSKDFKV